MQPKAECARTQRSVAPALLPPRHARTRRQDFVEVREYLVRLGLIETFSGGQRLTREGAKYLTTNPPPDLRGRISSAMM